MVFTDEMESLFSIGFIYQLEIKLDYFMFWRLNE